MSTSAARRHLPRVVVIEDDAPIRSALQVALEREGYAVHAASDGSSVERLIERFRPDLAILDIRLRRGPDGYSIARTVRGATNIPILFLTAADGLDDRLTGFEVGADDYMVKPFSMAELLARVLALLRRAGRITSGTRQVGDLLIDEGSRNVLRAGAQVDLTKTEYEVLMTLVRHTGQVLTKVQLLTQVWGFDVSDTNLVEVQISGLRRKLEAHGPRLVHTVHGVGYVLRV